MKSADIKIGQDYALIKGNDWQRSLYGASRVRVLQAPVPDYSRQFYGWIRTNSEGVKLVNSSGPKRYALVNYIKEDGSLVLDGEGNVKEDRVLLAHIRLTWDAYLVHRAEYQETQKRREEQRQQARQEAADVKVEALNRELKAKGINLSFNIWGADIRLSNADGHSSPQALREGIEAIRELIA